MAETTKAEFFVSTRQAEVIKATFQDNSELLVAMRNLFFSLPTTAEQIALVKGTFTGKDELVNIVRKKIYPIFEEDTIDMPPGLMADFWLDFDKDILGAPQDTIYQRTQSKQQVLDMLSKAIALLQNPEGEKVDMSYNPKLVLNDPLGIGLLARSLYIRTIGQGLQILKVVAEKDKETPEEKKKRIERDSSK